MLPIIINFLLYSISCVTYSLNSENGGLVTTTSDCLSRSIHSSERKSPSPFNKTGGLFFNIISKSDKSIAPSPFSSFTSVISILYGFFPSVFTPKVVLLPIKLNCVYITGEVA